MSKYLKSRKTLPYLSNRGNALTRDPYKLIKRYKRELYRSNLPRLRRGAKKYAPSRKSGSSTPTMKYRPKTHQSLRYAPQSYKPQPTPRHTPSSSQPWTKPPRSSPPPLIYKPSIEKIIRQLEKRFNKELHETVQEHIETKFQHLLETATKDTEINLEKMEPVEIAPVDQQIESPLENIDLGPEAQPEKQPPTEFSEIQTETATEAELLDIDEVLEWINEDSEPDFTELAMEAPSIESSPIETPYLESSLETLEQPALDIAEPQEIIELLNEAPLFESPAEFENPIGLEPIYDGLDEILDIIDPLDAIEPFEPWIETFPEILPEVDEMETEVETY